MITVFLLIVFIQEIQNNLLAFMTWRNAIFKIFRRGTAGKMVVLVWVVDWSNDRLRFSREWHNTARGIEWEFRKNTAGVVAHLSAA